MIRVLMTGLFAGVALLAPVFGQRFELKPKKISLGKNAGDVFPELELRNVGSLPLGIDEPRYKSRNPQRFTTFFGGIEGFDVAFASDELRGSGKGFDSLVADLKGEGRLSKGKRLRGKPVRVGSTSQDTVFPPFKVELPTGDDELDYSVRARLVVSFDSPSSKTPEDSTLYLTSLCCLQGKVEFDGERANMVVFDANCNGVFGEKGSPSRSRSAPAGDKIWVGRGSPNLEAAYVEALPLGRYFFYEDKYYDVSFPEANCVEIVPADIPLGRLKVTNPGFMLELVSGGDVLWVSNAKGTELNVPVGDYRLITPGFRAKKGRDIWELQGETGSMDHRFSVAEGEETELAVGPKLKLVTTATSASRYGAPVISLKFHIEGSQGETYKYLRKNGRKVPLPEIAIKSDRGKQIKKGRFEYG